jgi:DNA-binding GntR family transcriptional regulator
VKSLLEGAPEPLHRQVYTLIADAIAAGELKPGARLPAERVLCERFGVSRATIRRALRELVAEGLVEATVGRGSFVTREPLGEAPNKLMSFTELGGSRGLTASARVLGEHVRPSTLDEAERFGIAPGVEVFELERLRLLDGVPVAMDRSRVPAARTPFVGRADFTTYSLYRALEEHGTRIERADYSVQSVPADERQAAQLDVPVGAALLLAETIAYDDAGRVFELAETFYRGDRYRFYATLSRR